MSAFNIDAWHDFFTAQAAAGAALAGLVFVAISINLQRLLAARAVQGRAIEALVLLLSLLMIGLLALIPDQGETALGIEFIVLGLIMAVALLRVGAGGTNAGSATGRQHLLRVVLGQLAMLPVVIAGISLLTGDGGGLYWIALATIMAIIAGMIGAWVLLVEILR
jgi:modulator of FtsH protease